MNKMEVSGQDESKINIESKIDTASKTDSQADKLCQPCLVDHETLPAEGYCQTCDEYLCSSCMNVHRKLSATKNHEIKSEHEMPRAQIQTDLCSEQCAIHKTEIVKFYCHGHDSVGCGDCMVLNHKLCKVQLIQEVSGNYGNRKEFQQIRNKIELLEKEISFHKNDIKNNVRASKEMKTKVIDEIKLFRQELNSYLDHAEAELLKKIKELNMAYVFHQKKLQDECVAMETEIKEFQSRLDGYSGKMNHLFVTAKLVQKKLEACQEAVTDITSKCRTINYKFEPSTDLIGLKAKKSLLGTLTEQFQKKITNMKTSFVSKLGARSKKEGRDCHITGMVKISCDEILLADTKYKSLKVFNVKCNKICSRYKMISSPWDVTVIDSETVAVTLPDDGQIVFMKIQNGLSENYSLKVRKDCHGIDHRNEVIAVSFCYPSAIQVLDMTGDILQEFSDTSLFEFPAYLALSEDSKCLYVSDYSGNAVYELTIDGKIDVSHKIENLRGPRGLAVTKDGTVIVCCQGNETDVKMVIPKTKDLLSLKVQHVKNPLSILLSEDQNKMYISESYFSSESCYVKIFHLM